jgi:hypothetical protein
MANILLRLTDQQHRDFKAACDDHGDTMQRTLEKFAIAFTSAHNQSGIMHLNGELCPYSQLILSLSSAVAAEFQRRRQLPPPAKPEP